MESDSPGRLAHVLVGFLLGCVPGAWIGTRLGESLVNPDAADASSTVGLATKLGAGIAGLILGVLCFLYLGRLLDWVASRIGPASDTP